MAPCPPSTAATDVEYALSAELTLSDTPMGRGNGTYDIGPGSMVLRFDGSDVEMLSYTMRESFSVRVKTLGFTTTVTTDATSTAESQGCALVRGTFDGHAIHWLTPLAGYRTDGTISCSGSFCGSFGTPPRGSTALHVGPAPQRFADFVFSPDRRTFTMATTPGAKTTMPKQSSAVAMTGREVRRR